MSKWFQESSQRCLPLPVPSLQPSVRIGGLLGRPEEPLRGGQVDGPAHRAQLDPPLDQPRHGEGEEGGLER